MPTISEKSENLPRKPHVSVSLDHKALLDELDDGGFDNDEQKPLFEYSNVAVEDGPGGHR